MMQPVVRNTRRGVLLAFVTAALWGVVPLAMTPLLPHLDPVTIAWFRFLGSGLVLLVLLGASGRLQPPRGFRPGVALVFAIAVVALVGNYTLYVSSMHFIDASVAQIVVQLSQVFLMLGSMVLFGERFVRLQWIGFGVLLLGIAAFCRVRVLQSGSPAGMFGSGVLLMTASAAAWAVYGLAQKRLLAFRPSQNVLVGIYVAGVLLMLPFAHPGDIPRLQPLQLALLLFLVANTLVGYGAFAEALNHWDASRVGAVLALQPVVTLFAGSVLGQLFPAHFHAIPLEAPLLGAALVVVAGSIGCALGGRRGG